MQPLTCILLTFLLLDTGTAFRCLTEFNFFSKPNQTKPKQQQQKTTLQLNVFGWGYKVHAHTHLIISHLSLNRESRWGSTDNFATSFFLFPCSPLPSRTWRTQACSFPDVVFPPLPLSALSSSPFHCALQDGCGQTRWTGNMTIPLQFASLYDRQEVFVWFSCLLDLGTDFLVGNMVFVWDV